MKLGLTAGGIITTYGLEKALKMIKKSGFDAVDIALFGYWRDEKSTFYGSEDEFLTFFDNMRLACEKYELEISQTHGMLTVSVPDEEEQEHIKWGSELEIKATNILKAPACVFHSVKVRQWEDICLKPQFLHKKNIEFFEEFLNPICEKYNVKFALETHGRSLLTTGHVMDFMGDANNLKENYDMIKSDYKTICMDTGHINEIVCFGAPTVPETIRILGKDITLLHLHDNEGNYDSHLPPYLMSKNNVNWEETFDALDEIGYNGVYNYELNLARFGAATEDALAFLGKYLRCFTQNKGRM